MLSQEEFVHLQNLSALSLDDIQTSKLGNQLGNIVEFLSKLHHISFDLDLDTPSGGSLDPISGVSIGEDSSLLFSNSHHEKISKSIVINSVIDN